MMWFTILFVCTLRGEYLYVAVVVDFTSYATVVDIIRRDVRATDTIDASRKSMSEISVETNIMVLRMTSFKIHEV